MATAWRSCRRHRKRAAQVDQQFRALVPKKAMAELVKLADDAGDDAKALFSGDENHLFFQVGHRLLITRKLTGNFPDYERVLPKDHGLSAKLQKDEIKSAIERVAQFADERSRAIRVQFVSGEVRIFSSSVEMGESEESVIQRVSRVRIWKSGSTRNTCWISCAPFRRTTSHSNSRIRKAPANCGRPARASRISTAMSSCRCESEESESKKLCQTK